MSTSSSWIRASWNARWTAVTLNVMVGVEVRNDTARRRRRRLEKDWRTCNLSSGERVSWTWFGPRREYTKNINVRWERSAALRAPTAVVGRRLRHERAPLSVGPASEVLACTACQLWRRTACRPHDRHAIRPTTFFFFLIAVITDDELFFFSYLSRPSRELLAHIVYSTTRFRDKSIFRRYYYPNPNSFFLSTVMGRYNNNITNYRTRIREITHDTMIIFYAATKTCTCDQWSVLECPVRIISSVWKKCVT